MKEKMLRMLGDAISEVFETMFFLSPTPLGQGEIKGCREGGGREVAVQIETEDQACRIVLVLPASVLRTMSVNMLGRSEEGDSWETILDTAREAANMVAGAFLTRLDSGFRRPLGVPEVLSAFDGSSKEWILYAANVDGETVRSYLLMRDAQEGLAA
jgi:hypothetical protein